MVSGSTKPNPTNVKKRVEADAVGPAAAASLRRARDGSAFARCEECKKDVPVVLIGMHSCSLDAKIKMNLDAQVVEIPAEAKKKPVERKKATSGEPKAKKAKKEKASGNPNKPKRPPTAFFVFMEDFRKEFKDANPGSKDVKKVAKEGGAKWKSLSDEERQQYLDKAAELKAEYKKALESIDAENEDADDAGSDKESGEQEVHIVSDEKESGDQEVHEVSDEKEGGEEELQDSSDGE